MSWLGIFIGVVMVGGLMYATFFVDWSRQAEHSAIKTTNEERLSALGRAVDRARRLNK